MVAPGSGMRPLFAPGGMAERHDEDPDARVARLVALGARRPLLPPGPEAVARASSNVRPRHDLTMLAIGVFVSGTERLQPGSRYLIARTSDRLIVIGPVESSPEHVEIDLPIAGVEANFVPDRLVISGWRTGRAKRRFVLAFHALAGLTATAIDEALMERIDPVADAVGS
jgi:hypothetical protein